MFWSKMSPRNLADDCRLFVGEEGEGELDVNIFFEI